MGTNGKGVPLGTNKLKNVNPCNLKPIIILPNQSVMVKLTMAIN